MEEKPLSEYYLRKDGPNGPMKHRYNCKVCHSAEERERREQPEIKERARVRAKQWYAENREHARARQKKYAREHPEVGQRAHAKYEAKKTKVRDWLIKTYGGVPCMDCDGVFAWCAMDFDHRPGEVKEFGIGWISNLKASPETLARAQKEIAICDLVCSNCHRVRTQNRHE
jgi:predicted HNH restriction endonuclease